MKKIDPPKYGNLDPLLPLVRALLWHHIDFALSLSWQQLSFVPALWWKHIRLSLAQLQARGSVLTSCPALLRLFGGISRLRPASPCAQGSNTSGLTAAALSALLADTMLAIPSAKAGAVPTFSSAPPHTLKGRIPSCPCQRSQSFSPSFMRVNAQGVNFPCVLFGDHSCASPRLGTSTQEGLCTFSAEPRAHQYRKGKPSKPAMKRK